MAYKTIHTKYGLQRIAQSETSGVPINLVAMAVGDGNGNDTTPDENQTQLVRERYRAKPNRVFQDPDNPLLFTVELIVPATEGGFTIREAAVFDDQGGMFTVSNVPAAYKPVGDGSEGAFSDTAVRVQFLVANASVVSISIDPNVAVATQQWITNTITVPYLLPGGTTGQVLKKHSNADGDTVWGDPTVAEAIVSIVEEVQTLAASQTAVTLAECTTEGLAVYIAGARLLPSQWTPDATDVRKLTLATSYAAGTKADFVQNEPGADRALLQSRNLADVASAATARTNLGVYSKEEADTKAPPSLIGFFASQTAPNGWLKANGAAVSRTAYAALFAKIGTIYGAGDNFNTFNLPDMRGEFPRGWDDGRGADGNRAFGSAQSHSFASHAHGASSDTQGNHAHGASTDTQGAHAHGGGTSAVGDHQHGMPKNASAQAGSDNNGMPIGTDQPDYGTGRNPLPTNPAGAHSHTIGTDVQGNHAHNVTVQTAGAHAHGITVAAAGGAETRPRNVALLACIKY
ncbi:phage tail-collar fiber domain-containing protein [Paraburkholderia lycopersici]|uniref:Phage Tail Collar Domain n=1 Tax=Paraburkholderia lycopersici TaxID=416944 RepID=A0A1G7CRH6_9BURK|nr:phage tail protein [Paraburkholderia lycopersici]SDE41811.1 Phage Tail Collar Domain [Paraburkholderia lycopersici]